MQEPTNILADIEVQARELVGQQLRSKAMVVARLLPLINSANQLGHSHSAIHATLVKAGLDTTLKNYDTYLSRARARARQGKSGSYDPKDIGSKDPKSHDVTPLGGFGSGAVVVSAAPSPSPHAVIQEDSDSSSATFVSDTLRKAATVGKRDFSSVVKKQAKR